MSYSDGIYDIMSAAAGDDRGWDIGSGVPFENEVFRTIPFQWDCPHDGFDETCPKDCLAQQPNFKHFASGLEVSWYKRVGRSETSNMELPNLDWYRIIVECLESIKS